jgi:replicative DNA helicase
MAQQQTAATKQRALDYQMTQITESLRSSDRVPPQSIEAEQSVLGAVLLDKDAVVKVVELLRPEHFYRPQHALIYTAIVRLYEKRLPADLITLTAQLKEMNEYENVGGSGYLSTLVSFVPTATNVEHYANIVKEKAVKRQLISTSTLISELSYDQERDVQELLDEAEKRLFGISQTNLRQNFVPIKEALIESFDRLDELHRNKGGLRGVPTGSPDRIQRTRQEIIGLTAECAYHLSGSTICR